jgi:hypothetical protein
MSSDGVSRSRAVDSGPNSGRDELISLCPLSPGQARDQDKRAAGTAGDLCDTAQTIMLSPPGMRRF